MSWVSEVLNHFYSKYFSGYFFRTSVMLVVRSSLRIRSRVSRFLLSLTHACVRSVVGNRYKVKAPLVNDFAMTTYGDVIVKVRSFLTTGLGRGRRSALRPGRFTTKEKLLLLPVR